MTAAQAARDARQRSARTAAHKAEEILARPEFAQRPPPVEKTEAGEKEPDPDSLWSRFKVFAIIILQPYNYQLP